MVFSKSNALIAEKCNFYFKGIYPRQLVNLNPPKFPVNITERPIISPKQCRERFRSASEMIRPDSQSAQIRKKAAFRAAFFMVGDERFELPTLSV